MYEYELWLGLTLVWLKSFASDADAMESVDVNVKGQCLYKKLVVFAN